MRALERFTNRFNGDVVNKGDNQTHNYPMKISKNNEAPILTHVNNPEYYLPSEEKAIIKRQNKILTTLKSLICYITNDSFKFCEDSKNNKNNKKSPSKSSLKSSSGDKNEVVIFGKSKKKIKKQKNKKKI